ncbi:outer membrane beta-barrel protein [Microbulbifer sediminum]|uniref:outer membrane beta-barrel protein n=1 Tax=Microbulbifer sediminum TaxID=2904250 RepID=UPI001F3DE1A9|nr:outer membrane beta-barrel protein [Microbulbifer sediminum]
MKAISAAIALVGVISASSAVANEGAWYFQAGLSSTDPDASEVEAALAAEFGTDQKFGNASGYNLTLGYQLTPFIAVEGRYLDMGETEASDSYAEGDIAVDGYEFRQSGKMKLSSTGLAFGAVITTDTAKPFSAGVRAGFNFWDSEATFSYSESLQCDPFFEPCSYQYSDSISESEDGNDAYYGIVGTYRVGDWVFTLDHTVYTMDEMEPSSTTLSAGMRF